jgi:hypothetical protein
MPPRPTLVEALHSRELEAMLPWLVASAERSLRPEPVRPRAEQVERLQALLARAARLGKSAGISAHFRKFEEARDDELAAVLTSLRDLLEDDREDGGGR